MAFKAAGIELRFKGSNENEVAVDTESNRTLVRINSKFHRPAEVDILIGDPTKAKTELGWHPKTTLEQLCAMMVAADMERNEKGISL